MNSLMRAANFIIAGALKRHQAFASKKAIFADLPTILGTNARQAHNLPNTYDFARERILLVLRLYDKIDPEKLTLDSHFYDDLGLDSLDHVEIIMNMEEEFNYEIPDKDAEKLLRPSDLLRYITDKDEAYEELQRLEMEDHHNHHGHGHGHGHEHDHEHEQAPAINHSVSHENKLNLNVQSRGFSTTAIKQKSNTISDDEIPADKPERGKYSPLKSVTPKEKIVTSFFDLKHVPTLKVEEIQSRVLKVCSKYDKIDSTKLSIDAHFFEDLGLDSLDHVEILMELEDEFSVEIPDKVAEKLFRPIDVIKFISKLEEEKEPRTPESDRF